MRRTYFPVLIVFVLFDPVPVKQSCGGFGQCLLLVGDKGVKVSGLDPRCQAGIMTSASNRSCRD